MLGELAVRVGLDASPYVDALLLWDTFYWKNMTRRGLYPLWLPRVLRLWRMLRERRFDVFLSLQPEDWPILARGVGAPARVGVFDTFRAYHGSRGTSRRTRLYTHVYTHADLPAHRVDQYLLPLRALGLPEPAGKQMTIGYTEEDRARRDEFLAGYGLGPGDRFAVLAPAAGWATRCWPPERFAQLGDRLACREDCPVVLLGGAGDREILETVAAQMRSRPVLAAGAFGFRQMAALLDRAALLVSGDTGPMHVAGALGTPYVALFGPTPVAARAPAGGRGLCLAHAVPCGPCDRRRCARTGEDHLLCMRLLQVDEVYAAAQSLLQAPRPYAGNTVQ